MKKKKTTAKKTTAKKSSVKKAAPRKAARKKTLRSSPSMMARSLTAPDEGLDENRDNLNREVHEFCRARGWIELSLLFQPFKAGKIAQLKFHRKTYPNPGDKETDIREFAADLHRWLTAPDPGHPCKTNLGDATGAVREKAAQEDKPIEDLEAETDEDKGLFDIVADHYE